MGGEWLWCPSCSMYAFWPVWRACAPQHRVDSANGEGDEELVIEGVHLAHEGGSSSSVAVPQSDSPSSCFLCDAADACVKDLIDEDLPVCQEQQEAVGLELDLDMIMSASAIPMEEAAIIPFVAVRSLH